jgi:protein phosphatase 1 regulatory subunit 11
MSERPETQHGPSDENTTTAAHGSRTVVLCQPVEPNNPPLVLRLQGPRRAVQWDTDTVDNENLCRKSSKRCCIFHSRKNFGESDSDESDSDIEVAEKAPPKPGRPKDYQRHHA